MSGNTSKNFAHGQTSISNMSQRMTADPLIISIARAILRLVSGRPPVGILKRRFRWLRNRRALISCFAADTENWVQLLRAEVITLNLPQDFTGVLSRRNCVIWTPFPARDSDVLLRSAGLAASSLTYFVLTGDGVKAGSFI